MAIPTKTFYDTLSESYSDIKKEAGFYKNENINESDVRRYQKKAFAQVLSVVGRIYAIQSFETSRLEGSLGQEILRDLEVLLAAGYLMNKQYGVNQLVSTTLDEAADKIGEARFDLKQISKGEIKLFDKNNVEFPRITGEQSGGPTITRPKTTYTDFSSDQVF